MLRGLFSSDCITLKSTGPHLQRIDIFQRMSAGPIEQPSRVYVKVTLDCRCLPVLFGVYTPRCPADNNCLIIRQLAANALAQSCVLAPLKPVAVLL